MIFNDIRFKCHQCSRQLSFKFYGYFHLVHVWTRTIMEYGPKTSLCNTGLLRNASPEALAIVAFLPLQVLLNSMPPFLHLPAKASLFFSICLTDSTVKHFAGAVSSINCDSLPVNLSRSSPPIAMIIPGLVQNCPTPRVIEPRCSAINSASRCSFAAIKQDWCFPFQQIPVLVLFVVAPNHRVVFHLYEPVNPTAWVRECITSAFPLQMRHHKRVGKSPKAYRVRWRLPVCSATIVEVSAWAGCASPHRQPAASAEAYLPCCWIGEWKIGGAENNDRSDPIFIFRMSGRGGLRSGIAESILLPAIPCRQASA